MKKIFFALASLLLFATSCSNIDDIGGTGKPEQPATVSVNLGLPQMQTRAYSDGTTAKKLEYAVYDITADGKKLLEPYTKQGDDAEDIDISKPVSFQLVTGHTYGFVFWASSEDSPYEVTFTEDGATMTATYDGVTANNETLDAFYAYEEIEVNGDLQADVNLYRPFAQINVGTNDYEAAASIGYAPTQSAVTVSEAYSAFDLISGNVTGAATEVSFGFGTIPGADDVEEEDFPVQGGYDYLAMVYVLADKEQAVTDVTFEYSQGEGDAVKSRTVGSVPVQRNHRTNIFGQILTSNADLEVTIIPGYDGEFEFQTIADGVKFDEETETFLISNANGLQWISAQVNNKNKDSHVETEQHNGYDSQNVSFSGQTIILADDIDMTGVNWTPIGYKLEGNLSVNGFGGVFDGNGKTISNLTVSTDKGNNAGLFGSTNRATIKNLTLKDVNINGHYKTGAIVGNGCNVKIEDCHVVGGTITATPWETKPGVYDDANNVGGIVGYLNGQPDVSYVKNCTVDGLTITAFRKVGGIVGVLTTDDDATAHTSSVELSGCSVSNTTIIADMTETRYDGYASRVPAIGEVYGSNETPARSVDRVTINGNSHSSVTLKTIKPVTSENLATALSEAQEGATIYLAKDGEYDAFQYKSNSSYTTKNVTIDANGATFTGENSLLFNETTTIKNAIFKNYETKHNGGASNNDACGAYGYICGNFEGCTFEGEAALRYGTIAGNTTFKDCKFIATNEHAIHVDSSTGEYTVTFENCEASGYCPLGSSKIALFSFDGCTFTTNKAGFGGVGLRRNTTMTNCKFNISGEYDHDEIALKNAGFEYQFNGCTVNGNALTAGYAFAVGADNIEVTIDGVKSALTKTGDKPTRQ